MSLAEFLNQQAVNDEFVEVDLEDIEVNEKNFYAINYIEPLATDILRNGQNENGIGYVIEDNGLKRKYKLIGGERRYQALKLLNDRQLFLKGKPWKYILKIVPKPVDEQEETMMIISDNMQRPKSKKDRISEVRMLSELYDSLKIKSSLEKSEYEFHSSKYHEIFAREEKEKKRQYIARLLHISEITVQKILTDLKKSDSNDDSESEESNPGKLEKKGLNETQLEQAEIAAKNLTEFFGNGFVKVSISKKGSVSFKPVEDPEDWVAILEKLGFDCHGQKMEA